MRSSFSSSPAEPISRFVWRGRRMPRHKCSPEFQRDALLRGGDSNRSYHPTASGWHWLCWTESRVISGPCPRRQDSCGSSPTSARNRYSSRDASPGPRTVAQSLPPSARATATSYCSKVSNRGCPRDAVTRGVKSLYTKRCVRPVSERAAFIEACQVNGALRQAVEALLQHPRFSGASGITRHGVVHRHTDVQAARIAVSDEPLVRESGDLVQECDAPSSRQPVSRLFPFTARDDADRERGGIRARGPKTHACVVIRCFCETLVEVRDEPRTRVSESSSSYRQ